MLSVTNGGDMGQDLMQAALAGEMPTQTFIDPDVAAWVARNRRVVSQERVAVEAEADDERRAPSGPFTGSAHIASAGKAAVALYGGLCFVFVSTVALIVVATRLL